MRNLQKLTESLGNFQIDSANPLKSIGNMQEIFDAGFWEKMVQLTNYSPTDVQNQQVDDDQPIPEKEVQEESSELDYGLFDSHVPHVDLFQTPNKVIVCCELPGLERKSMEISLANNRTLTIKGSIARPSYALYLFKQERYYGYFEREIRLPHLVSTEGMKSMYVNGLLELHFYKRNRKTTAKEKITIHFNY